MDALIVFGPELRPWLVGLSAPAAVLFIRGLLLAEADRLGAPLTSVSMTGNLYAPDGGVDGHTDLPVNAETSYPTGPWSWQVKATTTIDLATELMKDGVLEDLASGRDYVIACTREFAGRARQEIEGDLRTAIAELAPGRAGMVLGVEAFERMATLHPAVVMAHGGPSILGEPLGQWARDLDVARFPYTPDARRSGTVEAIRSFARGSGRPNHLHVYGDTGVGKSRAVHEALAVEGLEDRVAANTNYYDGLDRSIGQAARNGSASIIVVDDCSEREQEQLRRYAGFSDGRLRLITVGDRPGRSTLPDASMVELYPLEQGTITALVERVSDLGERDARIVADLAEGYPKLAVQIAELLVGTAGHRSIADLLRGARVEAVLHEMLPDSDARSDLAHLALFSRLGFEGDPETESRQVCEAFGLGLLRFRATVERETGRFVSPAGRYRRVTPKALAVWLAQELMRLDPDRFVARISQLPESLFDEFRGQLELLGGDREFDRLLEEVLARRAGTLRSVADIGAADARLLEALAFAAPEVAAARIAAVIDASELDQLKEVSDERRRSLVWALQHLLWFSSTYERAAASLLGLAVTENERWSNNATGVLKGSFQLLLGGTEVPLESRLAWLRENLHRFGHQTPLVAAELASGALQAHETRAASWRGARLQPEEWRPRSPGEARRARALAIQLLGEIAVAAPNALTEVARHLAHSAEVAIRSGLVDDYVAAVRRISWAAGERATISAAIRTELELRRIGEPDAARLRSLLAFLEGQNLDARLATALATEYWQLEGSIAATRDGSQRLDGLVAEAMEWQPERLVERLGQTESAKGSTLFAFGRLLGTADIDGRYRSLATDPHLASELRVGYVAGSAAGDPAWVQEMARCYARDQGLAAEVPFLASALPATDELAHLAAQAVSTGRANVAALHRLRLGGWVRDVGPAPLAELLDACLHGDESAMVAEIGIGLLDTWLDVPDRVPTPELASRGDQLLLAAAQRAGEDRQGGLDYARNRLADRLNQPPAARLEQTLIALDKGSRSDDDAKTVEACARQIGPDAAERVMDFIRDLGWRSLTVERARLVSTVARGTGADGVLERVFRRTLAEQAALVEHIDFTGEELDPVYVGMLGASTPGDDVWAKGMRRFVYPGEVTWGPFSAALQSKLERSRRWSHEHPSPVARRWAEELTRLLEPRLAQQGANEQEDWL